MFSIVCQKNEPLPSYELVGELHMLFLKRISIIFASLQILHAISNQIFHHMDKLRNSTCYFQLDFPSYGLVCKSYMLFLEEISIISASLQILHAISNKIFHHISWFANPTCYFLKNDFLYPVHPSQEGFAK